MSDRSTKVVSKLRGGLMSVAGRSIDIKSIRCVTAINLHNSIVIERALYVCELWSNLTNTRILTLRKWRLATGFALNLSIP